MSLLALNGGSSSLKVALFDDGAPPAMRLRAQVERIGSGGARLVLARGGASRTRAVDAPEHASAAAALFDALASEGALDAVRAVGHRFVHGGPRLDRAQRLTPTVLDELRALAALDPTHLPSELAIFAAAAERLPSAAQVACFDTAFHRTLPRVARLLPIPLRYEAAGVRRYGFHGLSCAYLMEELARLGAAGGRVILAHLGAGASLTAVLDGKSVDTTMAFTPASGVMMATRSGDLDPGVLIHLLRAEKLSPDALDELINRRSGLAGVSETSGDLRELLARENSDTRAAEAVALFCHGVKKAIGALAAVLGGVDTLVFAGGIGEHAAPVRARAAAGLAHLGVILDGAANDAARPIISAAGSACTVRVLATDEESMIARETLAVLKEERP